MEFGATEMCVQMSEQAKAFGTSHKIAMKNSVDTIQSELRQ